MFFTPIHYHLGIISASIISFIFLNTLENVFHYSIGKNNSQNPSAIHLMMPTTRDWILIILVMITFAILQGLLTYYATKI